MFDEFSPNVGSLTAEPLAAHEIDMIADADRVWATITRVRNDQADTLSVYEDESTEATEDAIKDETDRCVGLVRSAIASIENGRKEIHASELADWIIEQIEELADSL